MSERRDGYRFLGETETLVLVPMRFVGMLHSDLLGILVKLLAISSETGVREPSPDLDPMDYPDSDRFMEALQIALSEWDAKISTQPMNWRDLFNDLAYIFSSGRPFRFSDWEVAHNLSALHDAQLLDWLKDSDVITPAQYEAMLQGVQKISEPVQRAAPSAIVRDVKKPGFVYVLKSETGHFKIGRTIDPDSRYKTFGITLPFRIEYELVIKADDYVALEKALHARFAAKRLDGEWFQLTPDDLEMLRSEYGSHQA